MENPTKNRGFTLVELVLVMAVIGILAAVGIPNFLNWLPNMRVRAAARDIYSNMQHIRSEAVKNNQDRAIVFNTANNTYSLCSLPGADNDWSTLADNTIIRTIDLTLSNSGIGYGHGSIPQGNSATTLPGNFPNDDVSYQNNNTLIFNSRGTCNPGYVYVQNGNNTVIAVGTQISGTVIMRRYIGGGTWK